MEMDQQQMRAVRYTGAGGTEVIQVGEEAVPEPRPGEVLVKVAAAGLNGADIAQRKGNYPPPKGASEIPGLEVSGTVAAVGEPVGARGEGRFDVGDRVCALLAGGGYAEYVAVPAGQLMAVPEARRRRRTRATSGPRTSSTTARPSPAPSRTGCARSRTATGRT